MKSLSHNYIIFSMTVIILTLAIVLRVWRIETHLIFFSDAGRDFLAAQEAIDKKTVPLLGIPSSVPRFRQGPVMVWLIMVVFLLTNSSAIAVGYFVAMLSVVTVILTYWLVKKYIPHGTQLLLILFMATSPLLIAHGRMPFHVSPIPLCTIVYLYALERVIEKKTYAIATATLAWTLLFQFELATTPMITGLLYAVFLSRDWRVKKIFQAVPTVIFGLLPQILYDLTHQFSHLGGFGVWVIYRIVSFAGYKSEHTFSLEKLFGTFELFQLYWGRVMTIDNAYLLIGSFLIFLVAILYIGKKLRHLPNCIQLSLVISTSLITAFLIHGTPSEAYFPPFFVLLPLLLWYGFSLFPKPLQFITGTFFIILATWNTFTVFRSNFFVQPTTSSFHYGTSYGEQRQIIQYIIQTTGDQPFTLASTDSNAHFASYLESYRFHAKQLEKSDQENSKTLIFLEHESSDLSSYPNAKILSFPSVDIVQVK